MGKYQGIFHIVLHFKIANFIVSEKIGTEWIQTCLTLLELAQLITEWGLNHNGGNIFQIKGDCSLAICQLQLSTLQTHAINNKGGQKEV